MSIIQQLEDLKEWSKDSTRYERRLAFRGNLPSTEAGTIPIEWDELSDREREYYRTGPWSTREDYSKGQLVQPGPGRQGYGDRTKPGYTSNRQLFAWDEDTFKKLDNLINNTTKSKVDIMADLGYKINPNKTTNTTNLDELLEVWKKSDPKRIISSERFKHRQFTADTPIVKKVLKLQEEGKSTRKIGKIVDRKGNEIRRIFREWRPSAIKEAPLKKGEKTAAQRGADIALANTKLAQKKAGIKTTEQADQVIKKIIAQNEIYQMMSIEDIAKDKDLLKSLRLRIDSDTGKVSFTGYTKENPVGGKVFTDLELAQHAKNKAKEYKLIVSDHITGKALKKQNVGYPINFQPTSYMENSQLENAKRYLLKNPEGNWKPIDNYLSSKNLTIRGPEFKQKYGFKLPITFNPETGTSNIVELSFKKTVPKIVRPKFVSFPANLADVKLGKAVKGWRGGALFEIVFGVLDYWDQTSKGKEGGWGGQAMANAIQTASFGILKTGDKKYVYELLKLGKEMGFDTTALEHVIDINKRDNVLAKVEASNASHLEAIKKKIDKTTDPEMKERLQEMYNERKMIFATRERERAEETDKIFDTYLEDLRVKKAGPVQLVSPEKLAATEITQEEADLPFEQLWTTATEQLGKEKTKVFPEASKRLDYEAGVIGDPLQTYIFNVPAWKKEHELFGYWNKTPKQEERAYLDSLIKLAEAGNPEPLKEYNERRGVYEEQPISKQSLINLTEQHPWLGYRVEQAGGGIAGIRRPWAIPPESGPDPYGGGLSSQFNRVKKLTE